MDIITISCALDLTAHPVAAAGSGATAGAAGALLWPKRYAASTINKIAKAIAAAIGYGTVNSSLPALNWTGRGCCHRTAWAGGVGSAGCSSAFWTVVSGTGSSLGAGRRGATDPGSGALSLAWRITSYKGFGLRYRAIAGPIHAALGDPWALITRAPGVAIPKSNPTFYTIRLINATRKKTGR